MCFRVSMFQSVLHMTIIIFPGYERSKLIPKADLDKITCTTPICKDIWIIGKNATKISLQNTTEDWRSQHSTFFFGGPSIQLKAHPKAYRIVYLKAHPKAYRIVYDNFSFHCHIPYDLFHANLVCKSSVQRMVMHKTWTIK